MFAGEVNRKLMLFCRDSVKYVDLCANSRRLGDVNLHQPLLFDQWFDEGGASDRTAILLIDRLLILSGLYPDPRSESLTRSRESRRD